MQRNRSAVQALNRVAQWDSFIDLISRDEAYQRIRIACREQAKVIALETFFAIKPENWENVFGLWNQVIQFVSAEQLPSSAETARWNNLARYAQMPFAFNHLGFMRINV
jgi:hypothetical protein